MTDENHSVPLNNRKDWQSSSLSHLKSATLEPEEDVDELPPNKHRKCTDCLMFIVFFLYVAGMVAMSVFSYLNGGDPFRLVYGSDHTGLVCNSGLNEGKPQLVFPRIELDILQQAGDLVSTLNPLDVKFFGVCASSCPQEGEFVCTRDAEQLILEDGGNRETIIADCLSNPLNQIVATGGCPNTTVAQECFESAFNQTSFLFRCFPQFTFESEIIAAESGCVKTKTITFGGVETSVCERFRKVTKLTEEEPTETNIFFETFNTIGQFLATILGDIIKAQQVILAVGVGVSLGIGLVYIFALYCCVGLIIWVTVVACFLVLVLFTLFCYVRAGILSTSFIDDLIVLIASDDTAVDIASALGIDLTDVQQLGTSNGTDINTGSFTVVPDFITTSETYRQEFETGAYIFTGVTILYLLLVLLLGSRINRAIEIFQEASTAIRSNPTLILLPVVQGVMLVLVTAACAVGGAFAVTLGEITNIPGLNVSIDTSATLLTTEYVTFSYSEVMAAAIFFGFLWLVNFINGVTTMITAGTVATWFWRGGSDHSTGYDLGVRAMLLSTWRTIRFHLGTVATGALLIAIVQFIRYIAAYIQSKMKDLQKSNRLVKCLVCCLNCFLACAERCIKFISRNGYIMCAIYGKSFCRSSQLAFFAIAHNLAQVATVTFLGDIIVRFGQILVTLVSGLITWYWLDSDPQYRFGGENELESFTVPVVVVMLFAWVITGEILTIYDVAVDTILLSWCQDKKLYELRGKKPDGHKTYKKMDDFVSKHGMTDDDFAAKYGGSSIRSL